MAGPFRPVPTIAHVASAAGFQTGLCQLGVNRELAVS